MAHMVSLLRVKSCLPVFVNVQAAARCLSVGVSMCMRRPVLDVPEPPKRPLNAYSLFVKDNYGRTSGTSSEIISELAKVWKNTSDEDKQPYRDQYERLKKLHKMDLQQFLDGIGDTAAQKDYLKKVAAYRSEKSKYLKHFRMKRMGLIKPRALSAINVYASQVLKEAPYDEEDRRTLFTKLNERWVAMDDIERQKFAEQAENLNSTRLAEYEARLKDAQERGIVPVAKTTKTTTKKATKKKVKKNPKNVKSRKSTTSAKKQTSSTLKSHTVKTTSKQSAQDRQFSSCAPLESELKFVEGSLNEMERDSSDSTWEPDLDGGGLDYDEFERGQERLYSHRHDNNEMLGRLDREDDWTSST